MKYTKITLLDKKTVILQDPKEIDFLGARAITGLQVNKNGDAMPITKQHLIQVDCISSQVSMRMNNHYATLEISGNFDK